MKDIIEKMKTTRILAALGVIGLVLGTITPYAKFNFFGYKSTISLWGFWEGKVIMLLAIANLLFIFKDLITKYVPSLLNVGVFETINKFNNPKYTLIPTIAVAGFVIYLTWKLEIRAFKYYNIGFYLTWLGVICLVVYAILNKGNNKTVNISNNTSENNSNINNNNQSYSNNTNGNYNTNNINNNNYNNSNL